MPRLVAILAALILMELVCAVAQAEEFSRTNAQLIYGSGFHDPTQDPNTVDGKVGTIALEHFGTWKQGDNYFLANLYEGDQVGDPNAGTGHDTRIYVKWVSRVRVAKTEAGPVRDYFVSGRIDRTGNGYYANMIGLAFDFSLPKQTFVGINIYLKKDRFNSATVQLSPFWYVTFLISHLPFLFTGYVDISGTDHLGVDVVAGPHLLADIGKPMFGKTETLYLGSTCSIHLNDVASVTAFQAELRWNW